MEIENQILDVLRLYEYSMSIGRSQDYHENCDQFLKLLLKRNDLNACWVFRLEKEHIIKEYSIPFGTPISQTLSATSKRFLDDISVYTLVEYSDTLKNLTTITIEDGYFAIYKLKKHGFLFLYSKKDNMTKTNLSQLIPVIDKFAITLEACKAYSNQIILLEKLKDSNKELSNYAHVVSHDLKSPLRNISALSSWIKEDCEENIDEKAIQYLDLINENIAKMEDLVNGILSYSILGSNNFKTASIDLNFIVKEVLNQIYIPKHIDINVALDLPTILGDTYRLQQLYQNLINNAIKYNDKEKGLIDIGYNTVNKESVFYIRDNGKGIDKKYHEKIFNIFQKLENTKNATGIGLSIVDKIVTNYGGKIWLSSELNKGTTFFFTLKK